MEPAFSFEAEMALRTELDVVRLQRVKQAGQVNRLELSNAADAAQLHGLKEEIAKLQQQLDTMATKSTWTTMHGPRPDPSKAALAKAAQDASFADPDAREECLTTIRNLKIAFTKQCLELAR